MPAHKRYTDVIKPELTANYTYGQVIKHLNKPLSIKNTGDGHNENKAQVYIFEDPDRPEIIKIGCSYSPTDRLKSHASSCGFKPLRVLFETSRLPESKAKRVETLVHRELGHFCRRFTCGKCSTDHREFFEISSDKAELVIQRWVTFMDLCPYENDNTLKQEWRTRISAYIDKHPPIKDHEDHDGRHRWWEALADELTSMEDLDPMDIDTCEVEHDMPSEANITKGPLSTPLTTRQKAAPEWPLWCILEALILFYSCSHWSYRYLLAFPNLIVVVSIWVLVYLEAFAVVKQGIIQFFLPKGRLAFLSSEPPVYPRLG